MVNFRKFGPPAEKNHSSDFFIFSLFEVQVNIYPPWNFHQDHFNTAVKNGL